MSTNFYQTVYKLVKLIPVGKIATYGQIAALLGKPRSARLVGWALNNCPENVLWQRVINHAGMISIETIRASKQLQAQLLQAEGVKVTIKDGNYFVDLNIYLWNPKISSKL